MKILFLVHNLGKTRHFENVILELARRGHWITLAAARKRKRPLKLTGSLHAEKRIDVVACPVHRIDEWEPYVRPLRQARDYVRFLHEEYAGAAKLSARAAEYAPPGWPQFMARARTGLSGTLLRQGLEAAERLVPADRYFEAFIRSETPDVVLVTPLVDFGSYQTDYVKAAHHLGIPVGFLPFSWDNLTNRGLVRIVPDRAIVWNERQQSELTRFHGVPASQVVVTGAPRFDDFFAMRPLEARGDFMTRLGLDAREALLLYLCSSNFVAPDEVQFVRRWIAAVRGAGDERLRRAAVLVRPHPANAEPWEAANLGDIPGTALWTYHSTMNADQALYDSLYHADAVVGLNTSAMIEAGILGKPVFTVAAPEFAGGQHQTLHFHYLLARNGGLVEVADTFDEHLAQLAGELRDPGRSRGRSLEFVKSFVRPRGLDRPAAPLMADAVEGLAKIRKRRVRSRPWDLPARWAVLQFLRRRGRPGRRQ